MSAYPLFDQPIDKDAEFDRINPGVYSAFKAEAIALKGAGFKHYSARTIVHVLRHHSAVKMGPESPFKLNDHISPYLGRRLVRECPEFVNWFSFRNAKSDEEAA